MQPDELRERRLRLGLSQSQLAARLDVTKETVSRWERGALNIAAPGMLDLAVHALECRARQRGSAPVRPDRASPSRLRAARQLRNTR